jgi:hypothetical protein
MTKRKVSYTLVTAKGTQGQSQGNLQELRSREKGSERLKTASYIRTAIVYDFDGTLARGNIQEHGFLPDLDIDKSKFWKDVRTSSKKNDVDEILVYMWKMLEIAKRKRKPITRIALKKYGNKVPLFEGVETWFRRISKFAKEKKLNLEHYVVSSGNYEIICGCKIFKCFKKVYASRYIFENGQAIWPGIAINYTTKTQFLFRINKGIENSWDNTKINKFVPMAKRPIPFSRMIFIGDGETDIPSMKMVRLQGGHSIAVFDPNKFSEQSFQDKVYKLIEEDRVHFVAPADYQESSQLDVTVKGILARVARDVGQ